MVRLMDWNKNGHRIKIGFLPAVITVFLILSSCIDDPPTHPEINDYQSYLNLVWELYDQKYVAFDVKNIDWDTIHEEYSHAAVDIGSYAELQDVIIQMIGTLEDKNAILRAWDPSQGYVDYPTCSPENEINYVDSVLMVYLDPWMFTWDESATWGYCIIDTIPYFAIKGFDYFFTFQTFKDVILNNIDAPGIIIDIRMSPDVIGTVGLGSRSTRRNGQLVMHVIYCVGGKTVQQIRTLGYMTANTGLGCITTTGFTCGYYC